MKKKSEDMIVLYEKEEDCCGCEACVQICSQSAISMLIGKEGYYYPKIDEDKCIKCRECIRICPIRNMKKNSTCFTSAISN